MCIPFGGVVAVVDDDASLLRALERSLAAFGYRVKAYASAEQYLEDMTANEISCAVIDIHLGDGLSGLDLARQIASSANPTPIVFMSGSRDPALWERAMDIGCLDFLEKPFPGWRLIEAIVKLDARDC